jgi:DNA-binding CsgD family transcriptional regulator
VKRVDLVRRIEDAGRDEPSVKVLRERILDVIRSRIHFDGHVFALTDPVTMVGSSPHADVPMLPWARLPETIRWRYLTPVNRVDTLVGRPAWSLQTATSSPTESLVWDNVLREVGVTDTAMISYADRYGVWGFLELWSTGDPFDADDLDVLTKTAPAITTGLREALARTFLDQGDDATPLGPAVLVLGPDLVVHDQTEGAAATLLQLLPPDELVTPIPAAAYNVGAALIAEEAGVGIGPAWSRIHLGGNRWVTVKASRLGEDIAVSIEPSTTTERLDLFTRSFGLSDRETEVVSLLGIGLDTKEIAGQLFLSDHTVNDHVKAVLAKTGARSRQVLLARATGR